VEGLGRVCGVCGGELGFGGGVCVFWEGGWSEWDGEEGGGVVEADVGKEGEEWEDVEISGLDFKEGCNFGLPLVWGRR